MPNLAMFSNYLSVSTFVRRAYQEFDGFDTKSLNLRQGDGTKKFIEEILPLTAFLKWFERPGRQVKCRYYSGNQNFDAKIRVSGREVEYGYIPRELFIEVTSPEDEKYEHLRREGLAHEGCVFGGNNIEKKKNDQGIDTIVSKPMAQDAECIVGQTVMLVKTALDKKNKKVYPNPCILVVQVRPERLLYLSEWLQLVQDVKTEINLEKFWATIIVDWATSRAFQI